ncbi:DUF4129 domain-containing protein [Microbacterium sp. NPDC056234]|uniref:DUF4129 domain-containing protein n=1 Tax=Microbacterium sp. NPDC056234 TaxID=3345757 RepID=UPI0035DF57F8
MRRLLGAGAVVALLLIVMVVASVQGPARFEPPEFEASSAPAPVVTDAQSPLPMPTPTALPTNETAVTVVSLILLIISAVVVAVLLFFLIRAIVRAWGARIPRREIDQAGDETFAVSPEPDPETAAPTIRRGIAAALRIIDEHAAPSDAIIAAWVGLEESAAEAGITRARTETPAEFTLRVITYRSDAADDAKTLLRLYERVRFAGHTADEADRAEARQTLAAIQEGWR